MHGKAVLRTQKPFPKGNADLLGEALGERLLGPSAHLKQVPQRPGQTAKISLAFVLGFSKKRPPIPVQVYMPSRARLELLLCEVNIVVKFTIFLSRSGHVP